ncbi:MAG TPA: phosphocarrier protein HPr [Lachnospiraceae bacterium]|nr:phosphocarrier protein HPr [Lachnospiraceae bacterium]
MAQTKIQLNAIEDVKELVNAAEKCDFDIDLSYGRIIVDAKSLLGILSLGIRKTVVVRCHGENEEMNHTLRKFAVA